MENWLQIRAVGNDWVLLDPGLGLALSGDSVCMYSAEMLSLSNKPETIKSYCA